MHDSAVATLAHVAPPLSLHPFAALRLAPSQLGDPASARAFARPYRQVSQRLTSWQDRGLVRTDPSPALYVHEYSTAGLTVRGLVGALDLSRRTRPGQRHVVLPHEDIHPAQSEDLAGRMEEMSINPAPILLVRHGGSRITDRLAGRLADAPDDEYLDRADQVHRFWRVDDPAALQDLAQDLAGAEALIADGHHRYAAYLDLQQRHPGSAWDQGLAMVVDQDDTPLHLGAIHRLISGPSLADLMAAVRTFGGASESLNRDEALNRLDRRTIVAYDGTTWAALALPVPADDLAVCALHARLLPSLQVTPRIAFHHAVQGALDGAERNPGAFALILPAPEFDVVLRHGRENRLLPEKATSFQPKPHTGALMRRLPAE